MLLEDIVLAVVVGVVLLVVGIPIARLLKVASWRKKDPLAGHGAAAAPRASPADTALTGLRSGVSSAPNVHAVR